MREVVLLKYGEIALKGLNRSGFEDILMRNLRRRLRDIGEFRFTKSQSTILAEPAGEVDLDLAIERMSKVFGIVMLSRACVVEKNFREIQLSAEQYFADILPQFDTFKVEARRSDKKFPMQSPELCRELGGFLLEKFPHLRVDVHNPQVTVTVEIRDQAAFLHAARLPGAGGIPVGSGGKAALLLSGGIDSPVAGYMMAKRGLEILAVHFESPPYTSERAKLKVVTLAEKLCEYCGRIELLVVPFTAAQEAIRRGCPEEYFTVIMRRLMMRVTQKLAEGHDASALITGESLGQVASQTVHAIACTDAVCGMPVLRPAIGLDKEEIIRTARKIDTYETSILPYEDCCTVFTPRHPRTRPRIADVEAAESALDLEKLLQDCVENAESMMIRL